MRPERTATMDNLKELQEAAQKLEPTDPHARYRPAPVEPGFDHRTSASAQPTYGRASALIVIFAVAGFLCILGGIIAICTEKTPLIGLCVMACSLPWFFMSMCIELLRDIATDTWITTALLSRR